jgi:Arginine kinase
MAADLFSRVEPAWINAPGTMNPADSIALLSCVRLRRNIKGFSFPWKCGKSALYDSAAILLGSIGRSVTWQHCDFRMLDSMDSMSRNLLLEMRLITPLHAQGGPGRFFLRDEDCTATCMINEEDHLVVSAMTAGLDLASVRERAEAHVSSLEVDYVYDAVLGYLTADPRHVGSAMRAGVLLHLPALDALKEMENVCAAFERNWDRLALYKLLSDEQNASGSFYLVSNGSTLAVTPEEIVQHVTDAAESLISKEIFARDKILQSKDPKLNDRLWRAWGLLRHARRLSFSEALEAFSFVKLGSDLGWLPPIDDGAWKRMVAGSQRYHLGAESEQIVTPADEPFFRATRFRQFIEHRSVSAAAGTD